MDSKHEEGRPVFFQGRYGHYMEIIWNTSICLNKHQGIFHGRYGHYMEAG